jgi:hypothetical protein
LYLIS